ncbi:MAG: PD-(D/E)XK nuclease family protein [Candidatus Kerfeldbacteria bacterium]|nr:PD-(D/E)XK nuclease family protein [Candidatus Kerfeldbacteria bacterium]
MPRNSRPQDAWERMSYSKFTAFSTCPLAASLDYIERVPTAVKPINAFGTAMHYLFMRFFKVNFKSPDTFVGAWNGFWMKVIHDECGPRGFSDQPTQIAWEDKEEPYRWMGKGQKCARTFYEAHAGMRGTGVGMKTEHRFQIPFSGIKLSGIIDRLDLHEERPDRWTSTIVDYKPGKVPPYLMWTLQFVVYGLAHPLIRHRLPHTPHLTGMKVYSYFSGTYRDLELPRPQDIEHLRQRLTNLSWYIWSVLHREKHPMLRLFPLRDFSEEDIELGRFSPRLPRGLHCGYCTHVERCREWELGNERHSAHTVWVERLLEAGRQRNATQQVIPIFLASPLP